MTIYYDTSDELIDEILAIQDNPSVCMIDYGYSFQAKKWELIVEVHDDN